MGVDLPPGKWTALLIGPWWPAPPTALRAAAQYWNYAFEQQEQYSQDLRNQRATLLAHNEGHTADDLAGRYYQGEQFHLDLAEKYRDKAAALDRCANEVDSLRSKLAAKAAAGNKEIDDILASKKPELEKLAEVQAAQVRYNAEAEIASDTAVTNMMAQTQQMLSNEGISSNAEAWARDQGLGDGSTARPRPITGEDLNPSSQSPGGRDASWVKEDGGAPAGIQTAGGRVPTPPGARNGGTGGGGGGSPGVTQATGGRATGGPPPAAPPPSPQSGVQMPAGATSATPGMPGINGAPMSPAAPAQGMTPGLGQSFASGMATGQSAGAGPQALSTNAINAMEGGSPPTNETGAPAPTPVAPSVPAGGAFIAANAPVDTPPAAPDAPAPVSGGATAVAPAVVTGGSWSATAPPVTGGPAGPLPAYGSDLRPPMATPSTMPAAPAGPVSGAPVAPSPGSSPSAGGPLVSPVERAAQGAAAGQAGASSSTLTGATAASATAGATAGVASNRAVEQQRLQRIVDAVARQEPRLSWAAGLRDDGTTTLLVTDLAGGWIPPHVRLPAHVTLLEPASRRRDASVVDLLGAIVVAAAHHANTYVGEPGAEESPLTGDRLARATAPHVDELGPTLVEAVRRRDGLPRIAQAIATPAVRKTGVLENEAQLLHECIADVQHEVLIAYPHHDQAAVGDWMLLAAIEALIDDHEYLANYHLAWFAAISRHGGS